MPAIVVGKKLCFDLGPRKLVVFRIDHKDLPHLTFSWNNPSQEIDVHLTPATPRDADDRESVLKITEADLKARVGNLGKQLWDLLQKKPVELVWAVNPNWLSRRGYVLVGSKSEPATERWKMALPKKRGKYRLDERELRRSRKGDFYPPTARNFERLQEHGQLWTRCKTGACRGKVLMLQRLDTGRGTPLWLAINFADLANLFTPCTMVLGRWCAALAPEAWERIRQALRLEEIGL